MLNLPDKCWSFQTNMTRVTHCFTRTWNLVSLRDSLKKQCWGKHSIHQLVHAQALCKPISEFFSTSSGCSYEQANSLYNTMLLDNYIKQQKYSFIIQLSLTLYLGKDGIPSTKLTRYHVTTVYTIYKSFKSF